MGRMTGVDWEQVASIREAIKEGDAVFMWRGVHHIVDGVAKACRRTSAVMDLTFLGRTYEECAGFDEIFGTSPSELRRFSSVLAEKANFLMNEAHRLRDMADAIDPPVHQEPPLLSELHSSTPFPDGHDSVSIVRQIRDEW